MESHFVNNFFLKGPKEGVAIIRIPLRFGRFLRGLLQALGSKEKRQDFKPCPLSCKTSAEC